MAHLVETMAYAGQTPWHGLGTQLPPSLPIDDWIIQAGMDWEILESPVHYRVGKQPHLGQIQPYEDHKVLYRSDTQAPLSVVGQRYNVVQPRQILEFYRDLTEQSGFELETAGVLKGGKKLWALAKTGQSTALKGTDVTNGYVLLATACDGTMATTAQFTSIRVVCNNTLSIAVSNNSGAVKVPHRSSFDATKIKQQLGIAISDWDDFMYRMKQLSDRKVNTREARAFCKAVLIDPDKQVPSRQEERKVSQVITLFEGRGMGADLSSAQGTAYGLLNAVTQFVDHEQRARTRDNRLDSAWFGQGANTKRKALDQALLLAA
jgi:phage/plasmid-like protein (TIGR03299 family)